MVKFCKRETNFHLLEKYMRLILKILLLISAFPALVQAGQPQDWQLSFQEAASPLAHEIIKTHNFIMYFMVAVIALVLLLLFTVIVKFRAGKNRNPSTTSHNTLLEIIWIVIPVIVVIVIAVPSVKLIFKQEVFPETEMTLKVIGRQWYWSYEYPDHDDLYFDSYMLKDVDLQEGQPRLLEVDNEVVLPTETYITVQMTSSDVIHAWALPALGIKMDAIPGRLNELWTYIEKPGVYYGQCSELCGPYHAFMPIKIRAVPKEEFAEWIELAKEEFASNVLPQKYAVNNIINN